LWASIWGSEIQYGLKMYTYKIIKVMLGVKDLDCSLKWYLILTKKVFSEESSQYP
jgi:hypothetical protein